MNDNIYRSFYPLFYVYKVLNFFHFSISGEISNGITLIDKFDYLVVLTNILFVVIMIYINVYKQKYRYNSRKNQFLYNGELLFNYVTLFYIFCVNIFELFTRNGYWIILQLLQEFDIAVRFFFMYNCSIATRSRRISV